MIKQRPEKPLTLIRQLAATKRPPARATFTAKEYKVKYSSRVIWENLFKQIELDETQIPALLRAVDKLDRLGIDGVKELLLEGRKDKSGDFMQGVNLKDKQASEILNFISNKTIKDDQLNSFCRITKNFHLNLIRL